MDLSGTRFYYRDGCHLCEEMAAVLFHGWPEVAAAMEWREVDARPEWRSAFGLQIPVLTLGDKVVCALRPDPEQLEACFGPRSGPL